MPDTDSRRLFVKSLAGAAALLGARGAEAQPQKQGLIARSSDTENLETPLAELGSFLTPNDRFFVRSNNPTPKLALASWRLRVGGLVNSPLTVSMEDLRQLPKVELVSVLECAGNGRSLYQPAISGTQWLHGAVGNARWGGVRLADVVKKAGIASGAKHVAFDGADEPLPGKPDFRRSISLDKAMDSNTLLAYEMNGEPLPESHGSPLRVVAPGWTGNNWVKWLTAITLQGEESEGHFQRENYRLPREPVAPGESVAYERSVPVTFLRVKSLIFEPAAGAKLAGGEVAIRGAAWSNGAAIERVGVSADGGASWQLASLEGEATRFGWRLWRYVWRPERPGYYVLMARATDSNGRSQPFVPAWNPGGYLNNAAHQVAVTISG